MEKSSKYGPFDEGVISIHSIDIPVINSNRSDSLRILNFSVHSQSGDVLSILVPARHIRVIQSISANNTISGIRFYSDVSFFIGEGIIRSVSRIKSGSEKGNYLIEMQVK